MLAMAYPLARSPAEYISAALDHYLVSADQVRVGWKLTQHIDHGRKECNPKEPLDNVDTDESSSGSLVDDSLVENSE